MRKLRTMHLFAGAGGGILGDLLLGHQPVCAVEINEYCQQVLSARQKDGCLPWFPIFADVTKFDGKPWRGVVDVVSGGFPCQDISAAGKGAGIDGERSGMWREMARIISEVRPRFVFVENSPLLVGRGLARVLGDLAAMGFDARWGVLGAHDVGAPHRRQRIWIVAHANGMRELQPQRRERVQRRWVGNGCTDVSDASIERLEKRNNGRHDTTEKLQTVTRTGDVENTIRQCGGAEKHGGKAEWQEADRPAGGFGGSGWWESEPELGRVADELAAGMDFIGANEK